MRNINSPLHRPHANLFFVDCVSAVTSNYIPTVHRSRFVLSAECVCMRVCVCLPFTLILSLMSFLRNQLSTDNQLLLLLPSLGFIAFLIDPAVNGAITQPLARCVYR